MAQPFTLQAAWSEGMVQDVPRHLMPPAAAWNMVDWMPDVGAPLRKRGAWAYASDGVASYVGSLEAVGYGQFTTGARALFITDDGVAHYITPGSTSVTDLTGSAGTIANPLAFHRDHLIIPSPDGSTDVQSWDGSSGALAALGATAPAGMIASVFKDTALLAHSAANKNRLWFSDPGDPTSWDTTNAWWDMRNSIVGVAQLPTAILIFQGGETQRLRGTTPPPGTDMVLEDAFAVGCVDSRSIVVDGNTVYWANYDGVWKTDGITPGNIIKAGGMYQYWRMLMRTYEPDGLAATVINGFLVISVLLGSTFIDCLICDLSRNVWFRASNIAAKMFASASLSVQESYWAPIQILNGPKLGSLTGIFQPDVAASVIGHDGNGTAIQPVLETPYYRALVKLNRKFVPAQGTSRWRQFWLEYELVDTQSNAPVFDLGYIATPEATSYTAIGSTLAAGALDRTPFPVNQAAQGIALQITQSGASDDTKLFGIEATYNAREWSR